MHLLCFKGLENSKNEVFVSFDTTFFYLCAFIWHIFPFLVYISPLFTQTLSNQSRNETGKPNLCSNLFHFKDLPLGWTLRTKNTQGRQLHFFFYFLSDASFYLIQIASFLLCSVIKFADVQYCYLITVPTFQILLLYNLVD